jgi:hypothetical protein
MLTCMHTHKHINTRNVLASLPPAAAAADDDDDEPGSGAAEAEACICSMLVLRRRAAEVTNFQHVTKRRGGGRARG